MKYLKSINKKRIIFCLAVFLTLSVSGCALLETSGELISGATDYFLGGEDNLEPPAELVEYTPEIELDVLWEESIGVGMDGQKLNLMLAISRGKVVAADREGIVEARALATGDLIWEAETDFNFSAGPGVGNQTVVLATSNAEVVALSLETGEKLWETSVSTEVLAKPVIVNDKVIIRTIDGRIIVLNESDGSQLWVFERTMPTLSIRGNGSPIIIENNIIAGYANGKLLALRLDDGKIEWETSIAIPSGRSEVERLVDLDVDPIETDGIIFISSYQGGTTAVLELDGDVLWRNEDISSYAGLNYDWRYLYISDSSSHVWQLDQRNGASLWKQDELSYRNLTAPAIYEDYAVVGDYDGYLHWLSINDGRQLGRIKIADLAIASKPEVIDDVVYIYANDGTLAAVKARLF